MVEFWGGGAVGGGKKDKLEAGGLFPESGDDSQLEGTASRLFNMLQTPPP